MQNHGKGVMKSWSCENFGKSKRISECTTAKNILRKPSQDESKVFLAKFAYMASSGFTTVRVLNTQHVQFALCTLLHHTMPKNAT